MSNYDQHMKHWKNHYKDRYHQQCSGPVAVAETRNRQPHTDLSIRSFQSIMDSLKCEDFPVYVKQGSGGMWLVTNERDSFGTKISDMGEMRKFYYDCVV